MKKSIDSNLYIQLLLIMFLSFLSKKELHGQIDKGRSEIILSNKDLIQGIDNVFKVIAQQTKKVEIKELSARINHYTRGFKEIEIWENNGYFIINPKTTGLLEIEIRLQDTIEVKKLQIKPLTAKGRLGKYEANHVGKIGKEEFRMQGGLFAIIECCGFDARCRIKKFEMLKISNENVVSRRINQGGKFEEETINLVKTANTGDIYVFRNIGYLCGRATEDQRLLDMIFEIR